MKRLCLILTAIAVLAASPGSPLCPAKVGAAGNIACDCVLYARSIVPSLPYGLFTQKDKARIINANTPKAGYVAIHSYNHVSVLTHVDAVPLPLGGVSIIVTLTEANFVSCKITTRKGTPAQLGIVGYFRP